MATILITGGTGVVGKYLSEKLKEKGYSVALLSRASRKDPDTITYTWDIAPAGARLFQRVQNGIAFVTHMSEKDYYSA